MTVSQWMQSARRQLEASGCPDPAVDARWMMEDTLNLTPQDLAFEPHRAIPEAALERLEAMLRRRVEGEPVQYILGSADFMGLRFKVAPGVLLPRQDTETLAEAALIDLRERPGRPEVLDLCAGSGCIGLSLASLAPKARLTLSDLSREALEVARENAREMGIHARLCQGDLFGAVNGRRFDLIVSNPPYIPRAQLEGLQREVRFEPALALDGGDDGLDFYRRIARTAPEHMNPGASLYLEVGAGQAPDVLALVKAHIPCRQAGTIKDLNGVERLVYGMRNEE
ncbi:MAG: peptide chain release factor N(5)-glutamine methyltransferase [Clostridia bacterium]|nr:peptide chain release factor N(5)-glutamine methyltransferase [Clostridia bacterium]